MKATETAAKPETNHIIKEASRALKAFSRRPSREERRAYGKSLRQKCHRTEQGEWKAFDGRPDPVALMEKSDHGRIPELVPLRHGRMLVSPFTFYRGAALNQAIDLAHGPSTGARVQACGDAHLMNFGGYATPERRMVFEINDLDETLPAPWEWDVKRLAVSFVLACRDNGLRKDVAEDAARACVRSYRESMARYGEMRALDLWYDSISAEDLLATVKKRSLRKRIMKRVAQARERSALEYDFPKLVSGEGEAVGITDTPPTIYHPKGHGRSEFDAVVRDAYSRYRDTLSDDRKVLLDRYTVKDIAVKVVGVGSVGTLCGVILLMAAENDPLFLQIKQARPSVLEVYAGKGEYENNGQRVVAGYRLMQSASDIFLGWTEGRAGRQFYIRQLRDAKVKPLVETFGSYEMELYAEWCGHALARAHARSGDAAVISGYLGNSERFDDALARYSAAYADQVESDYDSVRKAAKRGRLKVVIERS